MTEKECRFSINKEINIGDTSTELAKDRVRKVNSELMTDTCSRESERWKRQSVYRVPSSVTQLNTKAYKPHTVSIGPYHHGEEQLKGMEEHKQRALRRFVRRSKKPLQCYVNALAQVVQDLKDAYEQLDLKWEQDSEGFVVLMIVDGCFILELLRTTTATQTNKDHVGYASNDPVFSNHGKLYMLMLENQSASHDGS